MNGNTIFITVKQGQIKFKNKFPLMRILVQNLEKVGTISVNKWELAQDLSELPKRKSHSLFKIIKYHYLENYSEGKKIMGNQNRPYSCKYDKNNNRTNFDMSFLPDELIAILQIYINLDKKVNK